MKKGKKIQKSGNIPTTRKGEKNRVANDKWLAFFFHPSNQTPQIIIYVDNDYDHDVEIKPYVLK